MTEQPDDEYEYKFYIAPGASGGSPEEDKMLKAHEAEAAKHGTEFFNYGWSSGPDFICSKTARGILETRVHAATMKVSHHWTSWASRRSNEK